MAPERLAATLGISGKRLRGWLRQQFPRTPRQKGSAWSLTPEQAKAATDHFNRKRSQHLSQPVSEPTRPSKANAGRADSDESYVIDLCDDLLGEKAHRQHTFDWLVGDPNRHGVCRRLPVDAFYERCQLVIEYRERQHEEAVPFFDRRQTLSGVGRGEQRRLYDRRREIEIPKHNLSLLIITPTHLHADRRGRLRRDRDHDQKALELLLSEMRTSKADR